MKPLNAYSHGILDYLVGILLIVSPWLFGFDDVSSVATNTMVIVGVVITALSLMTDYPISLVKAVPFKTHGVIETIGAIFLVLSPWILGFSEVQVATTLALVVGIAWIGVVMLTNYGYQTRQTFR
jgi:drug/metabolite transporter (DMT)-like permease